MGHMLSKPYHIQFFLRLILRVWCYYLYFADKENEVQRGLATFRATNLGLSRSFLVLALNVPCPGGGQPSVPGKQGQLATLVCMQMPG